MGLIIGRSLHLNSRFILASETPHMAFFSSNHFWHRTEEKSPIGIYNHGLHYAISHAACAKPVEDSIRTNVWWKIGRGNGESLDLFWALPTSQPISYIVIRDLQAQIGTLVHLYSPTSFIPSSPSIFSVFNLHSPFWLLVAITLIIYAIDSTSLILSKVTRHWLH